MNVIFVLFLVCECMNDSGCFEDENRGNFYEKAYPGEKGSATTRETFIRDVQGEKESLKLTDERTLSFFIGNFRR